MKSWIVILPAFLISCSGLSDNDQIRESWRYYEIYDHGKNPYDIELLLPNTAELIESPVSLPKVISSTDTTGDQFFSFRFFGIPGNLSELLNDICNLNELTDSDLAQLIKIKDDLKIYKTLKTCNGDSSYIVETSKYSYHLAPFPQKINWRNFIYSMENIRKNPRAFPEESL